MEGQPRVSATISLRSSDGHRPGTNHPPGADFVLVREGQILTTESPRRFFGGNSFYTTAANRMSRHVFSMAVTGEDVIELYQRNQEETHEA